MKKCRKRGGSEEGGKEDKEEQEVGIDRWGKRRGRGREETEKNEKEGGLVREG